MMTGTSFFERFITSQKTIVFVVGVVCVCEQYRLPVYVTFPDDGDSLCLRKLRP